jgi:hypothetical protein
MIHVINESVEHPSFFLPPSLYIHHNTKAEINNEGVIVV